MKTDDFFINNYKFIIIIIIYILHEFYTDLCYRNKHGSKHKSVQSSRVNFKVKSI